MFLIFFYLIDFINIASLISLVDLRKRSNEFTSSAAVDLNGNLFMNGYTYSDDFPVQNADTYFDGQLNGVADAFVIKFDNLGNRLWATYNGGDGYEGQLFYNDAIAIDQCDNVYMGLTTSSSDIVTFNPGCTSYYDGNYGGNSNYDCFITKFTNKGELLWASYIGDKNIDKGVALAVDKNDNLFLGGSFENFIPNTINNLPLLNPGGGAYFNNSFSSMNDGFLLKFVPDSISAIVTSSPVCSCPGFDTVIVTTTCGAPPYRYNWSNGETTPIVMNLCAGAYSVVITDAQCVKKSVNVLITQSVEGCETIIPNIFTPNNDGINDKFQITNLSRYPNSGMEIYNRWGVKIYESLNYLNAWDGRNWKNQALLSDGVYFYIFHRSDGVFMRGVVTLIR